MLAQSVSHRYKRRIRLLYGRWGAEPISGCTVILLCAATSGFCALISRTAGKDASVLVSPWCGARDQEQRSDIASPFTGSKPWSRDSITRRGRGNEDRQARH